MIQKSPAARVSQKHGAARYKLCKDCRGGIELKYIVLSLSNYRKKITFLNIFVLRKKPLSNRIH